MKSLYASPLRVYLLLGVLALTGILCGLKLPISLFPNSAKPQVVVNISFGNSTTEEFLNTYGLKLEQQLHGIRTEQAEVSQLRAYYKRDYVRYEIEFNWGTPPREALKEVQLIVNSYAGRFPDEIRDSIWVWSNNENSGFLAVSFYSPIRSLDDLYNLLEPVLMPAIGKVPDAEEPELWNPTRKEIRVELDPNKLAALQLFPRDISDSITTSLSGHNGGSVTMGTRQYNVLMPRQVNAVDDLNQTPVTTPSGQHVHLSDVAKIDFGPNSATTRSFKTSGAPSLILFADPRPGGNVKRMSEDILEAVRKVMPTLPKDVQSRILVDPSEFIRAAIDNVFHEVLMGAALAVLVPVLFIGSLRNTSTAAIEIPLSMVLAFILMRFSSMNLNLISLGGLALSAGMNVDASVVVMENIFRHFEDQKGPLDFEGKLKVIVRAVNEVRFAVIASTLASLVVFLPLAFTSDLSYAILGDLAKTVVFSHGFSAFVALILVPTVRLHLMKSGGEKHFQSPIEGTIRWLENTYADLLGRFIRSRPAKLIAAASTASVLALLLVTVLPHLPKEVIGTPDTDWIWMSINTSGNTLTRQMESQAEEVESQLLGKFGPKIQYTFTQISNPNRASIMSRLKDKGEMTQVWKDMEKFFTNTPFVKYDVHSWNPAELPIPDPPQLRITVRDGDNRERSRIADELQELVEANQIFPHSWTDPESGYRESIFMRPRLEQWEALQKGRYTVLPSDLADLARVATTGRRVGRLQIDNRLTDINIKFPDDYIRTPEEIASLPVGVGPRLIPLKALARVGLEEVPPTVYREDERGLFVVWGKENHDETGKAPDDLKKMEKLIDDWKKKESAKPLTAATPGVSLEDAEVELHNALSQLGGAVGLSILLIFLTLVLQFGDPVNALLVLIAVPLGFIGVLVSLFVFRSTLSLNSILGVILLNGIAVANSIILVDFLKRLVERGMKPHEAAIEAGRKRLRPILITSLTTILGMLPIALGLGQGGRILQPLGIAVSGGLWVSMGLTLFAVPALQVAYLEKRGASKRGALASALGLLVTVTTLGALASSTPAHASDSQLSFDSALDKIVERSTNVGIQNDNLKATQAHNLPNNLAFFPTITLDAKRSEIQAFGRANVPSKQIEGVVTLNLFRFGADVAALRAGDADEDRQRALLDNSVLAAETSGVQILVNEIQNAQGVKVRQDILETQQQSHSIARQRYDHGLLPLQEVEKVLIDLDNAKSRLTDAQILEYESQASLVSALGTSNVQLDWPWKERMSQLRARSEHLSDEALVSLLSNRPDWRAAQLSVRAETERLSQARSLIFPSLDGSYAYGNYTTSDSGGPAWTGTLALTVPLFDHLTNFSNARAQFYVRNTSEFSFEQTRRDAKADWEAARSGFSAALASALAREKTLTTARKLYQDNLRRFQSGRINANDLVIDQTRLYDSEFLAIQGWSAAHVAYARLCHAEGQRVAQCK